MGRYIEQGNGIFEDLLDDYLDEESKCEDPMTLLDAANWASKEYISCRLEVGDLHNLGHLIADNQQDFPPKWDRLEELVADMKTCVPTSVAQDIARRLEDIIERYK